MSNLDKTFRDLELLNVKIDVWIDEEEYKEVYENIQFGSLLNSQVSSFLSNSSKNDKKRYFFSKLERYVKIIDPQTQENSNFQDIRSWKPLFLAKYLRAKIMEDGTDEFYKRLDDILIYLQRKLPYQYPKSNSEIILQHLYFQELSACGKPGLESLGFAVRAYDLLNSKNKISENGNHFSFELYKLWAKLNQGIGYRHSYQSMDAARALNEIIRTFEKHPQNLNLKNKTEEKSFWTRILFDQAIITKAEIQEILQFSYHTLKTLTKLKNRKKEHRLIKEALAYRDIGRLKEAKKLIKKLLGYKNYKHIDSTEEIFNQFDKWKIGKNKKGVWSKTLGLLFDYYLEEFASNNEKVSEKDVSFFVRKFKCYKERLIKSRPEKVGYYQQVARYLQWLATSKNNYKEQISELYNLIREELQGINEKNKDQGINLDEFHRYEYNRFTDSMEKFYKKVKEPENDKGGINYSDDEIKFLDALNHYEKEKFWLYDFKRLERDQRIARIEKKTLGCIDEKLKCFDGDDSKAFNKILNCSKEPNSFELSQYLDTGRKPLEAHDYETVMWRENDRFLKFLKFRSKHPQTGGKKSYHFMGLQRWNSQTPTITLSQGGGYFIYEQDENGKVILGIAIDPGFNFVDNLFHMGFTLNDIDFILISHAHLDHMRDFEPIISALLDLKKRTPGKTKKKIHAIMSLGVYHKLENIITNTTLREYLADTYIIDIDKEIDCENYLYSIRFKKKGRNEFVSVLENNISNYKIEITPTKAFHDDYSERSDSFDYIIRFMDEEDRECRKPLFSFGYTGDTKWDEVIPSPYAKCDVICIHLGALIESEKENKDKFSYYMGTECEALIEKKGHPYLFGLLRFLKEIKKTKNNNRLILVSEFGEELKGGIRIDLIYRLNQIFKNNNPVQILPVDIGLNVLLSQGPNNINPNKVWCFGCEDFVEVEKIRYKHFGYGRDEAIFYFCNTCLKSKPENVIQEKMRTICEFGIPLDKAE